MPEKSSYWKYGQKSITISGVYNLFVENVDTKFVCVGLCQTLNKLLVNIVTHIHQTYSRLPFCRKTFNVLLLVLTFLLLAESNSGTDSKPFYYLLAICWVLYLLVNLADLKDLLHWIVLEFLEQCNNTIASKPARCIRCKETICILLV